MLALKFLFPFGTYGVQNVSVFPWSYSINTTGSFGEQKAKVDKCYSNFVATRPIFFLLEEFSLKCSTVPTKGKIPASSQQEKQYR